MFTVERRSYFAYPTVQKIAVATASAAAANALPSNPEGVRVRLAATTNCWFRFFSPAIVPTAGTDPLKIGVPLGQYEIGGVAVSIPAQDVTPTASHTITANKFGIFLIQGTAAGVLSIKTPAGPQAYNDAAAALAAIPSADSNNVAIGYVIVGAGGSNWVAGTANFTTSPASIVFAAVAPVVTSTTGVLLPSGHVEEFLAPSGSRIAAIRDTADGTLSIVAYSL